MKNNKLNIQFSKGLEKATGKIDYKLSNDVVIHSAVQNSEIILKGLICALMGLEEAQIQDVILVNPIDFRNFADKELILDIKIVLNNERVINVEIQIAIGARYKWWKNRALLYLCRCFDNLKSGTDYDKIMPSTQISIVFDELFPDEEREFYAKYYLKNDRTNRKYTEDFALNILYIDNLDKATEEDEKSNLVDWAKAFKAETWEEIKQIAKNSPAPIFKEVAEKMYEINADTIQRELAEAHEKYVCMMVSVENSARRE